MREQDGLNKACQFNDVAKYNLPIWLIQLLKNQYPKHWHNMVTAFQSRPPLTLRVNRRHANSEQYFNLLQELNIQAKVLDEYAIRITEPIPVNQLPKFTEGVVSVQDFGAQQAAYLLNPQAGERVLDACAAPGGKTGHILELADCDVVALDIDNKRLARVQENLSRLNFQATLHCAPAENVHDGGTDSHLMRFWQMYRVPRLAR